MTQMLQSPVQILYIVAAIDIRKDTQGQVISQQCHPFLYTLCKEKADKLQKYLSETIDNVEVIPHELDEPVYELDLGFNGECIMQSSILMGEPDGEALLDGLEILRKQRIM